MRLSYLALSQSQLLCPDGTDDDQDSRLFAACGSDAMGFSSLLGSKGPAECVEGVDEGAKSARGRDRLMLAFARFCVGPLITPTTTKKQE
jgi:hypothetical protein